MPDLKRSFDLVASGAGLLLSAPVMGLVAGLVKTIDGSPVLFRQERIGKDRKPFNILKFRTMREGVSEESEKGKLTPLGRILRKGKLDELPQLFNILRGDMSLVGPRPIPKGEHGADDSLRQSVRPGMTGEAYIHGGNKVGLEERLSHDQQYVQYWQKNGQIRSFFNDIRILFWTPISWAQHYDAPLTREITQLSEDDPQAKSPPLSPPHGERDPSP